MPARSRGARVGPGARELRAAALAAIALALLAGALGGCSKCDPWWGGGRACHGAAPR